MLNLFNLTQLDKVFKLQSKKKRREDLPCTDRDYQGQVPDVRELSHTRISQPLSAEHIITCCHFTYNNHSAQLISLSIRRGDRCLSVFLFLYIAISIYNYAKANLANFSFPFQIVSRVKLYRYQHFQLSVHFPGS